MFTQFKLNLFNTSSKLRSVCLTSNVRFSTQSNKRITRLLSDTEVTETELKSNGNESEIKTRLVNRNPRNLEQLLFDSKPLGFELDLPEKTFWNKVIFETFGKYLSAKIVHNSGRVVVNASTKERAIELQLKSTSGMNAALTLGQVLALRALESGINQVFVGTEYGTNKSLKVNAFLDALKQSGLVLEEQSFIFQRSQRDL